MPRRKDNPTKAISALFGERILVHPHGKDYIITNLAPRRRKKSSEAQQDRQDIFKRAVKYAKYVLGDTKLKASYKRKLKGHRNVFQAAVAAFMQGKVK